MEDGVAGRGAMKERGVLGGSIVGIAFFQAATNASSVEEAAGRSAEKDLALAERRGRVKREEARRNMAETGGGVARLSQGRREMKKEK